MRNYYITCSELPSGIFQGQVIDVIKYLNSNFSAEIILISFVPWQHYKSSKIKIKASLPNSRVFPIVFGLRRFRFNRLVSRLLFSKNDRVITRSSLAFSLVHKVVNFIIYDGRAAVKAEVEEYDSAGDSVVGNLLINSEKEAVNHANFKLAVSHQLVDYWRKEFDYCSNEHIVIPCTISNQINTKIQSNPSSSEIKILFSGGIGAWQSFDYLIKVTKEILRTQKNTSVLFLTPENDKLSVLIDEFPDRFERKWVSHDKVAETISDFDYGLLLREHSITNKVASPVKFAEYLNAGLSVLISPSIGDFSEFVESNNCGYVIRNELPQLLKPTSEVKEWNKKMAKEHFFKNSEINQKSYKTLVDQLQNSAN